MADSKLNHLSRKLNFLLWEDINLNLLWILFLFVFINISCTDAVLKSKKSGNTKPTGEDIVVYGFPVYSSAKDNFEFQLSSTKYSKYKYKLIDPVSSDTCDNPSNYLGPKDYTDDVFETGFNLDGFYTFCYLGVNKDGSTQDMKNAFSKSWYRDTSTSINLTASYSSQILLNGNSGTITVTSDTQKPYPVELNINLAGNKNVSDIINFSSQKLTIPAGATTGSISYTSKSTTNLVSILNFSFSNDDNNLLSNLITNSSTILIQNFNSSDADSVVPIIKIEKSDNGTYCSIDSLHVLRCWGYNYYGQVGVNKTDTYIEKPTVVDSGTQYSDVFLGYYSACGITFPDSHLKCWGYNTASLGDALGTTSSSVPIVVDSGVGYLKVKISNYHICGLTNSAGVGNLKCWGSSSSGIGDGNYTAITPTVVDSGIHYLDIEMSNFYEFACGITDGHILKCWGYFYYTYGDGTTNSSLTPLSVFGGTQYSSIVMKYNNACAIEYNSGAGYGNLSCWGDNWYGQVGDGTTITKNSMQLINANMKSVSITYDYMCGIDQSDKLWCWGYNGSGQLGTGDSNNYSSPQPIDSSSSYANVYPGYNNHTCGITSTNKLKCWGNNWDGQLGTGDTTYQYSPTIVDPLSDYSVAMVSNNSSTCGITVAGKLKCWGSNSNGQLGLGLPTSNNFSSPVLIDPYTSYSSVAQIYNSASSGHNCAFTDQGNLKCWGHNSSYELADMTYNSKFSPIQISSDLKIKAYENMNSNACFISENGYLSCWGNSSNYLLDSTNSSTFGSPVLRDSSSKYKKISLGSWSHQCGITDQDQLKCWGYNGYGQIGDGTTNVVTDPAVIDSPNTYVAVKATNHSNTCALKSDGTLMCWGYNYYGTLGTGDNADKYTPTLVPSGFKYSQFASNGYTTCAIIDAPLDAANDKKLQCWGKADGYEVGDGNNYTYPYVNTPTTIMTNETFQNVFVNRNSDFNGTVLALTTDGRLFCWGNNSYGQCAQNTSDFSTVQNPMLVGSSYYKKISFNDKTVCAIRTDSKLECWGNNNFRQTGIDSTTSTIVITPTQVDTSEMYLDVAANGDSTCGITTNHQLKCWGSNMNGQVGVGSNFNKFLTPMDLTKSLFQSDGG